MCPPSLVSQALGSCRCGRLMKWVCERQAAAFDEELVVAVVRLNHALSVGVLSVEQAATLARDGPAQVEPLPLRFAVGRGTEVERQHDHAWANAVPLDPALCVRIDQVVG